jgi:hypothetical protein
MTEEAARPKDADFAIEQWVIESRARQGLPPKIEDPAILRKIARMMARPRGRVPTR